MTKYIVITFYENLGIHKRVVEFKSKNKAYEYIGGCRLSDTPYVVIQESNGNPTSLEYECYDMAKEKMIEIINED